MPDITWHDYSRDYTIDFAVVNPKQWIDHHCRQRMQIARNNFLPAEFGWYGYFLDTQSSESTTPDQIEYLLAKWDVAWSLETGVSKLEIHGRTMEIISEPGFNGFIGMAGRIDKMKGQWKSRRGIIFVVR